PAYSTKGTWADETDIRPTMLRLAGLADDYVMDGRVITEILSHDGDLGRVATLGGCYKQLNASVGAFGTDTLVASTRALAGGSAADDSAYTATDAALSSLGDRRDALASTIKGELDQAEFHDAELSGRVVSRQLDSCQALLAQASALAG
ncbi:MAG: hypothetical protein QOJ83_880, partial [Frankiales bacterium]|nr:hypothetical protein [Frankiales bacterium]